MERSDTRRPAPREAGRDRSLPFVDAEDDERREEGIPKIKLMMEHACLTERGAPGFAVA